MEVRVRPAKQSDKAPLMSFIKDVWGGHDYIPSVWDHWMRNKRGKMFVVEAEGTPVGMNRVRFLEDGSAWFEGARVHPAFRGRGFATLLGNNSMKFARSRGASVYRLTSGSRNRAAHRQIRRMKFREVTRFSVYEPPKARELRPTGRATQVSSGDLRTAMRLFRQAREFRLGRGVHWHDFSAALLSQKVVSDLIDAGAVWRVGDAMAVTRIGGEGEGDWEEVCYLGGPVNESVNLVKALMGRKRKATERFVFMPQGSPIITGLRKEGYRRNFSMILFERRVANG